MKRIARFCISLIIGTFIANGLNAQEMIGNGLEIDKMVHNFGDIMLDSGPVSCEFIITNKGSKPAVIYNVISSCGCTDVEWTKEPIKSGGTGKISVTYSNDEGPYPFDKSLTLYLSDVKKPIILKLRGISREKMRPLTELYPIHHGPMGMKEDMIRCGNLEQGRDKSETVMIANISSNPIKVDFRNVSEHLNVSVHPNPIPAEGTAELTATVSADRSKWGRNEYSAVPVIDGKEYEAIGFWAFTKENFDDLSEEERMRGPMPRFEASTYSFGTAKVGTQIHATYKMKNEGKSCFCVYKLDVDSCCYSHSDIPAADPGEEISFRVHLDTKDLPKGECLKIVTLTTNSPLRPIVNLFISGTLE
jgi:hypothetical protein